METFRLRETKEFLSIDELKEKCETVDNFMEILKVNWDAVWMWILINVFDNMPMKLLQNRL